MKNRSLVVGAVTALLWLTAAGCGSRKEAEPQAVTNRQVVAEPKAVTEQQASDDARKVVAFYLPRVLTNEALVRGLAFRPALPPGTRPETAQGRRLHEKADAAFERNVALLLGLGRQEFHGLTGLGNHPPGPWNISGQHYVRLARNAVFGGTTAGVSILVMHPDALSRSRDKGVEVPNDPGLTGVTNVTSVRFLNAGVEPPASQPGETNGGPIEVVGGFKVYVGHKAVKP